LGGKTTSTSAARLNQIAVQTSTLGLPLTIGWGRGRIKCNLIWYNAFKAIAHTTKQSAGGKGMGGASKSTTYTYTASVIMALSEGQLGGVRTVYKDTSVFVAGGTSALAQAGLSLANGAVDQPVWGYLQSYFPAQAMAYSGIAYVYAQDYALGDSATLANHSFEVDFAIQLGGGVCDADPKDIVTDFLQSTSHGVPGWAAGLLGDLSDWSAYCRANNLLLSPVLESQASAASYLGEWTLATNSAAFWSEGVLKIKPYGDAAATANGVTWTPDLTPRYGLNEDDFIAEDGEAPVVQTIKDQSDAYNIVQVEYLDRSNAYNIAIQPAQDLANIVEFGARKQDPTTLHCICDGAIAAKSAQLLLQRTLYVRETYNHRLPWNFVLLEPMDLLTLTTTTDELKLDRVLVRITEIEEDEDGLLSFTCEGVDAGTASAAQYSSHSSDGYVPNTDVAPGAASVPALFVPPVELTGFDPEVWIAAASTSATWGGAEVWISADGSNYSRAGRIEGPARYGTITAALPFHADPDNVNMLAVNLSVSLGELTGGSAADMNAGATLALVGNELISYQNATLTGAHRYNLSPLRRGLHGSAAISHAIGQPFVRIDDAIFKLNYTDLNVGDTLYIKLASFNVYGRALQDLADVTAYTISLSDAQSRYTLATGAAEAASELAAGKSTIFYQATPPTAAESSVNDRWVDEDAGNLEYKRIAGDGRISYAGTVVTFPGYGAIVYPPWAPAPDQRIAQALLDAAGAQATADGKVETFNQESTPTAEGVGDLWYKPSTKTLSRWSGTTWDFVATYGATSAEASAIAASTAAIATIVDDDILSRGEKPQFEREWLEGQAKFAALDARAAAFGGVSSLRAALTSKYTTLGTAIAAISPAYSDKSQDSPLGTGGGAALKTKWTDFYAAYAALDVAITASTLLTQWSVDGSTAWHNTATPGDLYQRQSTDGGATWSAAVRVVGEDGAAGAPGITPVLSKPAVQLDAFANGTLKSGALTNAIGTLKLLQGSAVIATGVTYSAQGSSPTGITATIDSAGAWAITSCTIDSGSFTFRAAFGGQDYDLAVSVSKNKQGSAAYSKTGPISNTFNTNVYQVSGSIAGMPTSAGAGIQFSATVSYGVVSGSATCVAKAQYRINGGTWTDFTGSEATGNIATASDLGSVDISGSLSSGSIPADATIDVQVLVRKTVNGGVTVTVTGEMAVAWA